MPNVVAGNGWTSVPLSVHDRDLRLGVIGDHIEGIERVVFDITDGVTSQQVEVQHQRELVPTDSQTYATRHPGFWLENPSVGSNFVTGTLTVSASLYAADGVTAKTLDDITVYVDIDGTLIIKPWFYASGTGDDVTGDGSRANPFRTIKKAVHVSVGWVSSAARGDAGRANVRLLAGSFDSPHMSFGERLETVTEGWLTIEGDPDVDRSLILIDGEESNEGMQGHSHLCLRNVTLSVQLRNGDGLTHLWLDGVNGTGAAKISGAWTKVYRTGDSHWENCTEAIGMSHIERDTHAENCQNDIFSPGSFNGSSSDRTLVNCRVTHSQQAGGIHGDILQIGSSDTRLMVSSLRATGDVDFQGIFTDPSSALTDVAIHGFLFKSTTGTRNSGFQNDVSNLILRHCDLPKLRMEPDGHTWTDVLIENCQIGDLANWGSSTESQVFAAATFRACAFGAASTFSGGIDPVTGDPTYVDAANDDYRLTSSSIGVGTAIVFGLPPETMARLDRAAFDAVASGNWATSDPQESVGTQIGTARAHNRVPFDRQEIITTVATLAPGAIPDPSNIPPVWIENALDSGDPTWADARPQTAAPDSVDQGLQTDLHEDGSLRYLRVTFLCDVPAQPFSDTVGERLVAVMTGSTPPIPRPVFRLHPEVEAQVGDLIANGGRPTGSGWNVLSVFDAGPSQVLRELRGSDGYVSEHHGGQVARVYKWKVRFGAEQGWQHFYFQVHSGLPYIRWWSWQGVHDQSTRFSHTFAAGWRLGFGVCEASTQWAQWKVVEEIDTANYAGNKFFELCGPGLIGDGQGVLNRGSCVFFDSSSPPAANSPEDNLRQAERLAWTTCMSTTYAEHGNYPPCGVVQPIPDYMPSYGFALERSRRNGLLLATAAPTRLTTPDPFHWDEFMSNPIPGDTGSQNVYGVSKYPMATTVGGAILAERLLRATYQEAARPIWFMLPDDASADAIEQVSRANTSSYALLSERPHNIGTVNKLGKPGSISSSDVRKTVNGGRNGAAPAVWGGHDGQHNRKTAVVAALFTGDVGATAICRGYAEIWCDQSPGEFLPHDGLAGEIRSVRDEGRSAMTASTLFAVTGHPRLKANASGRNSYTFSEARVRARDPGPPFKNAATNNTPNLTFDIPSKWDLLFGGGPPFPATYNGYLESIGDSSANKLIESLTDQGPAAVHWMNGMFVAGMFAYKRMLGAAAVENGMRLAEKLAENTVLYGWRFGALVTPQPRWEMIYFQLFNNGVPFEDTDFNSGNVWFTAGRMPNGEGLIATVGNSGGLGSWGLPAVRFAHDVATLNGDVNLRQRAEGILDTWAVRPPDPGGGDWYPQIGSDYADEWMHFIPDPYNYGEEPTGIGTQDAGGVADSFGIETGLPEPSPITGLPAEFIGQQDPGAQVTTTFGIETFPVAYDPHQPYDPGTRLDVGASSKATLTDSYGISWPFNNDISHGSLRDSFGIEVVIPPDPGGSGGTAQNPCVGAGAGAALAEMMEDGLQSWESPDGFKATRVDAAFLARQASLERAACIRRRGGGRANITFRSPC